MRHVFLWIILLMPVPSLAEMYDAEYQKCNKNNTMGIVDCVMKQTKLWDKRLNTSYKELMERTEVPQQEFLTAAQRLWIKYRDANCDFYYAGQGSIKQIHTAECLRSMTRDRTCELQEANNMESGAGPECRTR